MMISLPPITDNAPIDRIAPRGIQGMGDVGNAEAATQVLISPVFRDGSDRRRRLLRRARCGIAALCLAYLMMLGVSITAMPVLRTPLGMATTRRIPAAGPATRRRNPAVAAARLPAPPSPIPDVDDRDEPAPAVARTPAPTLIPVTTGAPQTLPTPPAHHSHRRAAKMSAATTSVMTTATRVADRGDHGP